MHVIAGDAKVELILSVTLRNSKVKQTRLSVLLASSSMTKQAIPRIEAFWRICDSDESYDNLSRNSAWSRLEADGFIGY